MVLWESWLGRVTGVVTQRFFMVSGMGWLRTHYNGKSGLLIHTVMGCRAELSWAELQVATAADGGATNKRHLRTSTSHNMLTFCGCPWLFLSILTEHTATGGAVTAVQLTGHTCLAQRHDTVSPHTRLCMQNYTQETHALPPSRGKTSSCWARMPTSLPTALFDFDCE